LYHLNKRLVFEEEMDREEVGTRWFFNRDKPSHLLVKRRNPGNHASTALPHSCAATFSPLIGVSPRQASIYFDLFGPILRSSARNGDSKSI